jgi:hypothetical protein
MDPDHVPAIKEVKLRVLSSIHALMQRAASFFYYGN